MKNYDSEQQKAIEAHDGHYLVLAPPGCGKTDILAERIVRAQQRGVGFDEMLCLTFTNRASRGMRERVRERVGSAADRIFVGNVHRFCSNFLFSEGIVPENASIIDELDLADILLGLDDDKWLLSRRGGTIDRSTASLVDNIAAYIAQRRLGQPAEAFFLPDTFEQYYRVAEEAAFDPTRVARADGVVRSALLYERYKRERGLVSFSDLLILAYEALRGDTAHAYRRYRWIQVDEVQDLNPLQTAIIDALLDRSGTFTVMYLGDEQQAIFSFLGAKLGQLERLRQRCAGRILTLGTNYRSPRHLLEIFNTYAEKELNVNPALLPQASREAPHERLDLILTHSPSAQAEADRVTRMIDYYLRRDDERVAILVPTNRAADRISERLTREGITHFKISGTDMFKSVAYKTLAAFFAVSAADFDRLSWARLLHGIGAFGTGAEARSFVGELKGLMMTPSDLLAPTSRVERFCMAHAEQTFVVFGAETTGPDVHDDLIVRLTAFKVCGGQRIAGPDLDFYLETDRPLPAHILDDYKAHPHIDRASGLRRFLDYVGDCPLLGHDVQLACDILRANVAAELMEEVSFDVFDTRSLAKAVCPGLRSYRLEALVRTLRLKGQDAQEGQDLLKAQEVQDIQNVQDTQKAPVAPSLAAVVALAGYCHDKALPYIPLQKDFRAEKRTKAVRRKAQPLIPLFENLADHLYQPVRVTGRTLADELRALHDDMAAMQMIEPLGDKFNIFLQYVQSEWVDASGAQTLRDQIISHIGDLTASLSEGDLVGADDLVHERVFIMTVYKGKGLEFDNVVVLQANDGVYPFYSVSEVLSAPEEFTPEEVAQAETDCREDARKFYVALSRARKRLCISYTARAAFGHRTGLTPFMRSIKRFFFQG